MQAEVWKPIPEHTTYEVSDLGNVRSIARQVQRVDGHRQRKPGFNLKAREANSGYLYVGLYVDGTQRNRLVHRLVLSAFKPTNDKSLEANHLNGNRQDNRSENLEWCTSSENNRHAHTLPWRKSTRKLQLTKEHEMAKLIDDPKVQELLAKAADKATKEQDKAVKAETKRNLETVKSTVGAQVDAAKAAGNKDVAKALAQLGKNLAAAIKSPI